jgi:hypothetical protein
MILENIEGIQMQLDLFDEGVKFYSKCDTELSVSIFLFVHLCYIFGYININYFIGLDVFD